jgi:cytochrome P450
MIDPETGKETLAPPPPGAAYIPWAVGPRVCPGKKFNQVEFVAVIAMLLRSYRLKPLVIERKMKAEEQAKQALIDVMYVTMTRVTVSMRHPENAGVVFLDR